MLPTFSQNVTPQEAFETAAQINDKALIDLEGSQSTKDSLKWTCSLKSYILKTRVHMGVKLRDQCMTVTDRNFPGKGNRTFGDRT